MGVRLKHIIVPFFENISFQRKMLGTNIIVCYEKLFEVGGNKAPYLYSFKINGDG